MEGNDNSFLNSHHLTNVYEGIIKVVALLVEAPRLAEERPPAQWVEVLYIAFRQIDL